MKIGVFDSGIGGKAIANSLQKDFPDAALFVVDDAAHLPYGDKPVETVRELTNRAIQPLLEANVDVLVLACNTATAAAIDYLRDKYPDQIFIGLEPMVKPATTLTKTDKVIVCATPTTLSTNRYQSLKERYGNDIVIEEPDCSTWASMVEKNEINTSTLATAITPAIKRGADTIVLACTHYHWIRDEIQAIAPDATIIDPSEAISKRIKQLLGND